MLAEKGILEDLKLEGRVDEVTEELRSQVKALAEQSRLELDDMQAQMQALGQQVATRAATAKGRIAAELHNAAVRIREDLDGLDDDRVKRRAQDLAHELDRSADYLQEHSLEEVGQDVTETAQENVWEALGIAFFLGLLLGLLIGSSRR